jgi:hypothetical protein
VDRGGKRSEGLVHVPFERYQPRLVLTYMRQRPKSVHLQLEDVVSVVEWLAPEYRVRWCELRKSQGLLFSEASRAEIILRRQT